MAQPDAEGGSMTQSGVLSLMLCSFSGTRSLFKQFFLHAPIRAFFAGHVNEVSAAMKRASIEAAVASFYFVI